MASKLFYIFMYLFNIFNATHGEKFCESTKQNLKDVSCTFIKFPFPTVYMDANNECANYGMKLPTLDSEKEKEFLEDSLKEGKQMWIDMSGSDDDRNSQGPHDKDNTRKGVRGKGNCLVLTSDGTQLEMCNKKIILICKRARTTASSDNDDRDDKDHLIIYVSAGVCGGVMLIIIIILVVLVVKLRKRRDERLARNYFEIHASSMSREERDRHSTLTSIKNKPHIRLFSELQRSNTPIDDSTRERHDYCEVEIRPWGTDDVCGSTDKIVQNSGEAKDSKTSSTMFQNNLYDGRDACSTLDSGHYDLDGSFDNGVLTIIDNDMYGK